MNKSKLNNQKIILIIPPTNPDGQLEDYDPREPLGILYLSAVLRKNNFIVELINADMMGYSVDKVVAKIVASKAKYVGISVVQRSLSSLKLITEKLQKKIKNPDFTVIVGGHQPTLTPDLFLKEFKGIDYAVIGEGEKILLNLINVLNAGQDRSTVKGIWYKEKNKINITEAEDKIADLDSLPFPSRDFLPDALKTIGFASLVSSRGCFGNCSFCGISEYLKRNKGACWRGRSPKNVVDEIEELHNKFKVKIFKFNDDEMFGPGKLGIERIVGICDEIINRGLKIKLLGYCRVTDVNEKLFLKLKKTGFVQFLIGVESFSQMILNKYRKGVLVEHNIKAIEILNKLKIQFTPGFMPFTPYTTLDTFLNDLKWIRKYKLFSITPSKSLTIHQGTPIEADVDKEGNLVKKNPIYGYSDYFVDPKVSKLYYIDKILFLKITKNLKLRVFETLAKSNFSPDRRRQIYNRYRKKIWMLETKLLFDVAKMFKKEFPNLNEIKNKIRTYLSELSLLKKDSLNNIDKEKIVNFCVLVIQSNKNLPIIEKYVWKENDIEKMFDLE